MTNNPKALIVDDDPAWLEELVPLLSNANYDVETVSSFDIARDKLLSTTYAAIIIDLELEASEVPRTFEGFGLLSGIRFLQQLPRRQGKAIVLSAYGEIEQMRQAFKSGAYDFLHKQEFDENTFLDIVREVVDLWESGRALTPERELTSEEKKEYERVTLRFLRGQPIHFDMPHEAVNPWSRESESPKNENA